MEDVASLSQADLIFLWTKPGSAFARFSAVPRRHGDGCRNDIEPGDATNPEVD